MSSSLEFNSPGSIRAVGYVHVCLPVCTCMTVRATHRERCARNRDVLNRYFSVRNGVYDRCRELKFRLRSGAWIDHFLSNASAVLNKI